MLHSHTVEYAMRATVFLGARPGQAYSARAIAEETDIPAAYTAKVLKDLARAGLLRSLRGRKGGFELARPTAEVSLLDVVNAVAPMARIHACPLGRPEHDDALCPLHAQLDANVVRTEAELAGCTIAGLLEAPVAQRPYCGFPHPRENRPQEEPERGKMGSLDSQPSPQSMKSDGNPTPIRASAMENDT